MGATSPFEPIEHSLYFGRLRLGRYIQIAKRRVDAFGPRDEPLGAFKSRVQALTAIRKASHPLEVTCAEATE